MQKRVGKIHVALAKLSFLVVVFSFADVAWTQNLSPEVELKGHDKKIQNGDI